MLSTLKLKPVFLSDSTGQPAWAVLSYEEYQSLLSAAGVDEGSERKNVQEPVAAPSTAEVPTNATAQLLASLVENAQAGADDGVFDAQKFKAKVQMSPLSLDDLARSAGISASYLAMIERGEREPSGPVINSLARALAIAPAELNSAP